MMKKAVANTFDSQGRRTEYKSVTNGAQNTWLRFLYDGYLCVQVLYSNEPYNVFKEFVWDPTEPVATRPLVFRYAPNSLNLFYTFDGNKNVSDVFYRMTSNGIGAHYDYAPFGATTRTHSDSSASFDIVTLNPFRFSSEYYDSELDLVYYNYRHYSPSLGRFLSRDPIEEQGGLNLYAFVGNLPTTKWDILGMATIFATINDNMLSTIMDFLNGGESNTWIFTYPHNLAKRLLSHPGVSIVWNLYEKDLELFCDAFPQKSRRWKGRFSYTANFNDFQRDVVYLLGGEGVWADGFKDGDISVNMFGSLNISYNIFVDCCKKKKSLSLRVVDNWTIESLTRNPKTREPIIDTDFLEPIQIIVSYTFEDKF